MLIVFQKKKKNSCQLDVIYYSIHKLIFMHYFKL